MLLKKNLKKKQITKKIAKIKSILPENIEKKNDVSEIKDSIENNFKNKINKKQPMINIRTKFNNFSKKGDETPIKLRNLENNESQNISIINTIEKNDRKKCSIYELI